MFCTSRKSDHPLDTDPESTVWHCTILTKVKVEFILCTIHSKLFHLRDKSVVVFLTHGTTDDFSVAFWCKQVCTKHALWVTRNWFHIKCLDSCWVVDYEGWNTKVVWNPRFVWWTEVISMLKMLVISILITFMFLQKINSFVVSDAFEWFSNVAFQEFCIPF